MATTAAQPAMAPAGKAASHPYTCNTCQVAYRNIDLQKGHMRSDWHRYNLKRRVASLPPISADTFTDKVLQARATSTAEAEKAYFERVCDVCQKTYYSENAYQNHVLSQKHKQAVVAAGQQPPQDDETTSVISSTFTLGDPVPARRNSVDSDAEEEFNQVVEGFQNASLSKDEIRPSPVKRPSNPQRESEGTNGAKDAAADRESNNATPVQTHAEPAWSLTSCIFCNYNSPSLELNTQHMQRFHGMFIPEMPYLVNLEGLIEHLQRVVHEAHECLYCGKFKPSVFGLQTHMRDKGHCKIPFTTENEQLEIGEFYDFRSTYSDDEDDEEDEDSEDDGAANGGARLGARRAAKVTNEDGEEIGGEEGDGWETDSSESSLDSEDLTAVPAEGHIHQYERLGKHPHHSSHDPRQRHQLDGWHSHAHKHTHAVFHDDVELHLPSGKSVGHRSMNKYYRQNLYNYPTPEERAERQAIEAAKAGDETDDEPDNRVTVSNGRNKTIVPRGALGMTGVSDKGRDQVKRAEQRGRARETASRKKMDYAVGKKLNNQKSYYYRYTGGG